MKNNETIVAVIFGALTAIAWIFPAVDLRIKWAITGTAMASVVFILLKEKLSFFFRKNWQLIVSFGLFITFYLLLKNAYPELLIPSFIILLTSISITILLMLKYRQAIVYKTKQLIQKLPMNLSWKLNHWGSNCASIANNKMIFSGTTAPQGADGSYFDLFNVLEIGINYEVGCWAQSVGETTGKFHLWCHDKLGEIYGVSVTSVFNKTPAAKGEFVSLIFRAEFNRNIRIHLEYKPGRGQIEVSDVTIFKLTA